MYLIKLYVQPSTADPKIVELQSKIQPSPCVYVVKCPQTKAERDEKLLSSPQIQSTTKHDSSFNHYYFLFSAPHKQSNTTVARSRATRQLNSMQSFEHGKMYESELSRVAERDLRLIMIGFFEYVVIYSSMSSGIGLGVKGQAVFGGLRM